MTEGWLVDSCLLDLATGKLTNLTAVDRVSIYNTGLFYLPDGKGFGFTPLIKGVSKPFVMDFDGKNKRDVSGAGGGFAYGYSASPDGKRISYHENYQIYISNADGRDKRKVETRNTRSTSCRSGPPTVSGCCSSPVSTTTATRTS
ncbi:MAG: TolB family protein [Planctomycetota bacterium]